MNTIRPAAVAGLFYPGNRGTLAQEVGTLLAAARPDTAGPCPKVVMVPHAGYVYSGAVAAAAYARLEASCHDIRRVVLIGPAHRVAVRGLALPQADAFATPLGNVPLDTILMAHLARLPQVSVSAAAHAREHSLEVQLPFLQTVLGEFSLVPLVAGNATPDEVAQVLELCWGGAETLIVVSSDLSHYLPYAAAQRTDRDTLQHILRGDAWLDGEQACGSMAVNGLMLSARSHRLHAELLDARNSGDTAGDHEHVVGYAAIAYLEPDHHD